LALAVLRRARAEAADARPASSSWRLREDACAGVGNLPESMEAAGRTMFEEARAGGELTDMEFVLDSGRRMRGHKVWLMAGGEYRRGMLSSGMREGKAGVVRVRECG